MTKTLPLQALAADGSYHAEGLPEQYQPYLNAITPELLQSFYREMTVTRAFDLECTALQRQGELGLWVPSLGQEAAQVGSGFAYRKQDFIFPAYREHAIAKVRGMDLLSIVKLFRGLGHGTWNPKDHNFNIYTLVIGSQTLHATGYAMGLKFDGKVGTGDLEQDAAVGVYFGDGATSQGDVNEAFVFAASYQSPVLFFLQNNNWAISVPVTTQSRTPLYLRGGGFGIPSVQIDGNDVIASYAVSAYWLDRIRSGNGPALIEAITYRMGAHTSSDDPSRYQNPEVFEAWKQRDPIDRLRTHLRSLGTADSFFEEVSEEAKDFARDIRKRTLSLESPPREEMFQHVYSEPHPVTDEQLSWLEQYEAAFLEQL